MLCDEFIDNLNMYMWIGCMISVSSMGGWFKNQPLYGVSQNFSGDSETISKVRD